MIHKNLSKEKIICWVDHLSLFSWIKLLSLKSRYNIKQISYFSADPRILGWARRYWVNDIHLSEIHLETREILLHEIIQKLKDVSSFNGQGSGGGSFRELSSRIMPGLKTIDREKLEFYLTQQLAIELRVPLGIIHQWSAKGKSVGTTEDDSGDILILLQDHYFMSHLRAFYKERVPHIEVYANAKEIFQNLYYPFKVFLEILANIFLLAAGRGRKSPFRNDNPQIAVFYTHGVDVGRRCDYFWLPESKVNKENTILYFKLSERGPTEDVLKVVRESGIFWVNLLPVAFKLCPFVKWRMELNVFPTTFYIRKLIELLWAYCGSLRVVIRERQRSLLWFCSRMIHVLDDVCFFEAFFQSYNIKIHYGAYEAGRHMMAANMAIQAVGGVDLSHHWSNYDQVDIDIGKPHDVYFTWGPYYYEHFFNQNFYHVRNFVYTGYPYDYILSQNRETAYGYRRELMENGAAFIISFFDQTVFPVHTKWNAEQERLYIFLLEYLLHHPQMGLILKPKKPINLDILTQKSKEAASLMRKALTTRRLLVLAANRFPSEAALASDLAVGVGVSSTPCMEAALAGIPAITYNPEACCQHPMYAQGQGKTIFSKFDELIKVIDAFVQRKIPKDTGDYSFIIQSVDPFRDGKARNRVGFYVRELLQGFQEGKDKNEALRLANTVYCQAYGEDKIRTGRFNWSQN